jgi:hypothetical protein
MFAEFGNIPDIPLITISSFILNKKRNYDIIQINKSLIFRKVWRNGSLFS